MFKLITLSIVLSVLLVPNSDAAPAYQVLPPREGHIPVYIRNGDTPLSEINPDLAEAFHEELFNSRKLRLTDELVLDDNEKNNAEPEGKKIRKRRSTRHKQSHNRNTGHEENRKKLLNKKEKISKEQRYRSKQKRS